MGKKKKKKKEKKKEKEKEYKVTVGTFMLYFFRTQFNEAYIANVLFAKSARTFTCFPEFYFFL